jgi:hypothetical protein
MKHNAYLEEKEVLYVFLNGVWYFFPSIMINAEFCLSCRMIPKSIYGNAIPGQMPLNVSRSPIELNSRERKYNVFFKYLIMRMEPTCDLRASSQGPA